MSGVVVEASGVTKRYGGVVALDGVGFRVYRGEVFMIIGPNGSGKSTLLSIIAGAERPDSGYVRVLGHDPWREQHKLAGRVSAVLDRTNVYPLSRGIDLARLAASSRGASWEEVLSLAEGLEITGFWLRPYAHYSSGMRRRLLILLALIGWPEVIILDEPLQAIDRRSWDSVVDVIVGGARRSGSTVIIATHIVPRSLVGRADRVMAMELGKAVALGHVESVEPATGEGLSVGVRCIEEG